MASKKSSIISPGRFFDPDMLKMKNRIPRKICPVGQIFREHIHMCISTPIGVNRTITHYV